MKKKKFISVLALPLILTGCAVQTQNENLNVKDINLDDASMMNMSSTVNVSSNYTTTGYPSIYGAETHTSSIFQKIYGTTTVPSSGSSYHDCGVKVYGNNTATNIGSTSVIRLNSKSPYFDFTDANYMVLSSVKSNMMENLEVAILTDFNIEVYKDGTKYFHAGANTTFSTSGNNINVDKVTYDKNGSYSTVSNVTLDVNNDKTDIIDFSKLGKIASSLNNGSYTINLTYKYMWFKGDTTSSNFSDWNYSVMQTTAKSTTNLVIDDVAPTIGVTKTSDGSTIENGGYSNSAIKITVTDDNSKYLYYKKPSASSYTGNLTTSFTTSTETGWHYFYAVDLIGNQSKEYKVYIDTTNPTGSLYVNGSTVANNSYTNQSFSYVANDADSGIYKSYYKTPTGCSFIEYSSGSIISSTSGDGLYQFYTVDKAGNKSDVSSIYLETQTPLVTIKKNGEVVYTHSMTSNETLNTNLYFKDGDTIEFDYSSKSGVCSTSLFNVNKQYTIDSTSYSNKEYTESITSAIGISNGFKFNIVREKPTMIINGTEYQSGTNLKLNENQNVKIKLDSIITSGTNTLKVTCGGLSTTYDLLNTSAIELSAKDNEIKTYTLEVTDASGKSSTYTITIDKKPTEGSFISNGVIVDNNGYTNKSFYFTWDDENTTATISKDGGIAKPYNLEEMTEDGQYTIVLTDESGNVSEFRITIDTVVPEGTIYVDNKEAENNIVTTKSFYFTWDGIESCLVNGKTYKKNTVIDEEGLYTFVLSDLAGNSSTYRVEIDRTAPIGNEEGLKNQTTYAVSKWYQVNFNNKITYFKSYDEALEFAIQEELENNVEEYYLDDVSNFTEYNMIASNDEVKEGKYYLYKSVSNSNIKLYYFNGELLKDALSYYAQSYVEGPVYLDSDSKATGTNVQALLWKYNDVEAPIGNSYVLTNYGAVSAYAINQETNEKEELNYESPLGEQLDSTGLYLITETDGAGNSCSYYVIIDKSNPELVVNMETYSNRLENVTLTNKTISSTKTYYLKSLDIIEILDNDPYSVVSITYNGLTDYYTLSDTLPSLTEGGTYQVKVYDRLEHEIDFNVVISSEEEIITFANNTDDTNVSINISYSESNLTITSLEIYRNDTKLENVTANKLEYVFEKDGSYKVILKDNFGRLIEKSYTFNKSLPTGNLNTTTSRTNQDIIFQFDNSKYNLEVYKDNELTENIYTGYYEIVANDSNSGDYKFILVNNTDEDNKNVYKVTLDTIAPTVILDGVNENNITNGSVKVSWTDLDTSYALYYLNGEEQGEFDNGYFFDKEGTYAIVLSDDLGNKSTSSFVIDKTVDYTVSTLDGKTIRGDATTSEDIVISSIEDSKVTIIKDGDKYPYELGDILTEEGTYLITVCDPYGNKQSFTISIDKSVDFDMNVADGGITNGNVVVTANEKVNINVTKDGSLYPYNLGDEINEVGKYSAILTDAYGNEKVVNFEIATSQALRSINYDLGDNTTITKVTKDGEEVEYDSNHLAFTKDGEYEIFYVQNSIEYSFKLTLDTTAPELALTGVEDGGKVDGKVTLSDMNEPGTYHVYKDGVEIEYKLGDELSEYGDYKVVVSDTLGNTRTYTFTLAFKMNGFAIALIAIGVVSLIGLTTFIVLKRKRIFKKK